jgi:hypothetical protein
MSGSSLSRAAAAGAAAAAAATDDRAAAAAGAPADCDEGMVFLEAMDYSRDEGVGKRTLDQFKAVGKNEPLKQNFVPLDLATKYNVWGLPQQQQQQSNAASYDVPLPDKEDDDSI